VDQSHKIEHPDFIDASFAPFRLFNREIFDFSKSALKLLLAELNDRVVESLQIWYQNTQRHHFGGTGTKINA
jgi:hypothetical protein